MRIKKKLIDLLDKRNYFVKDFEIGLTDGEVHKYYLYNYNPSFVKGFETQDSIVTFLEEKLEHEKAYEKRIDDYHKNNAEEIKKYMEKY